jgi:hypothetical protein
MWFSVRSWLSDEEVDDMRPCDAFQHWFVERSAVEAQMDELITGGLPSAREERQARHLRFLALLERRDVAARELLRAARGSQKSREAHRESID